MKHESTATSLRRNDAGGHAGKGPGGSCGLRNFGLLGAFASLAVHAFWSPVMAADPGPVNDESALAWSHYLHETKGILDIRTIVRSGDGPNFLDIGIVSAGFAADQADEFYAACEGFTKSLLSQATWNRYRSLINVHGVFVGDKSLADSRVKVHGYEGNILSCDNRLAVEYSRYAANTGITVVIHNSGFSTGACGPWGVLVLNKGTVHGYTGAHELGHGFAGLGDEYIQYGSTAFNPEKQSLEDSVNVTSVANPKLCKWHYWVPEKWPGVFSPHQLPEGRVVVNAEGAGWVRGAYRAEETCIMRGPGGDFCLPCNETMEASFFRYIDLFKTVEPAAGDMVLWKGESVDFRVSAIDMLRNPPEWLQSRLALYVNGSRVASSERGEVSFPVSAEKFSPGVYQLGANLTAQSDAVRRDFGFLSSNRAWRMTVLPHAKPGIVVEPLVSVSAGRTIDVPVAIKHAKPSLFSLTMANAPDGAVLENGRFQWNPEGKTGSWRVDFSARDAQQHGATESMQIHVRGPGAGKKGLEVALLEPIDAVIGTKVETRLKAISGNSGNLLFEAIEIPDGVNLDRYTGQLSWVPSVSQAGPQRMRFSVKDGSAERELDVLFRVSRESAPSPIFSGHVQRGMKVLEELKESPVVYRRLFETLRLLRDRSKDLQLKALNEAKALYPELDSKLQENCIEELNQHAWEFAGNPGILGWMREICRATRSEQGALLIGKLDQIERYNTYRVEIAAVEDLQKEEERKEALVGVITSWQMSKVCANGQTGIKELVDSVFPPERGSAADREWITVDTFPNGMLDIRDALDKAKAGGPRDNCAVYLRAWINVPEATDARLELGSDDGVKVWLNGDETFSFTGARPITLGGDKVGIRLAPGKNALLVKVVQGGGDWQAYARIRDRDGDPVPDLKIGLRP